MRSNPFLACLIIFALQIPSAHSSPESPMETSSQKADQKVRRYKIGDLRESKYEMRLEREGWFRRSFRYMAAVGTTGLFLILPGLSLRYRNSSDRSSVDIREGKSNSR